MAEGATLRVAFIVWIAALSVASEPVAAQVAPPPVSVPDDPDQQIKCKKFAAVGSIIRKIKVCKTIAEWRRAQQAGNDAARAIVGENVCSGGECRGYEPPDAPP
ncbi:hypothetical protein [Sphingorhabdus contaminans]|uniref:hypothetical protein n=1 Tax=Sphingorhabdus contaminans TaxID=1343899 RepID=UPI003D2BBC83